MQTWLALKAHIAQTVGLDRDALLLAASLAALLVAALILRRPLSSPRPWLLVLALCLADEFASAAVAGAIQEGTIAIAWRDVVLVMAIPTVLLLATRYLPLLTTPEQRPLRIVVPLPAQRRRAPPSDIVDAEFEEVADS